MKLKWILIKFLFLCFYLNKSQQQVSTDSLQNQQFFFANQQSQFEDKNKLISKEQNYNPGIEVQVTNESLNDLSQKIGNLLQKKLLYLAIPDIDTVIEGIKVKINDGEIDFFVISENEFYFSQTQDGESIIKYNIQIEALQIEFNYMLQKNALLKFKDKGIINLQKFQLTAEVQPLNQNGKLIIEPTNINLYLGEVTVYLGNSSIKYLAAEILQTAIQQFLENIQEKVQETILNELKQIGNLFPQFVNFKYAQNLIIFNLELVYDPYIQNETLYLGFNGEFYEEGKKPSYINPKNQFKPINDSKATRIFADQDVFNSLFETLFSIKKQSFQLNFPAGLGTTSTFNSMTMVSIFPQMKKFVDYFDWRQVSLKFDIVGIQVNFEGPQKNIVVQINSQSSIITSPIDSYINKCGTQEKSLVQQIVDQIHDIFGQQFIKIRKNNQNKYKNQQKCALNDQDQYNDNIINEDREIYAQNIETQLKLTFNIVQQDQKFGIQLTNFQIPVFKPTQTDINNELFNFPEIYLALDYMQSLILQALNGYLFNVNSVDIEKLLGNSVNEVEFRFYEKYFAFLIDF